jgi:hypothetical protein
MRPKRKLCVNKICKITLVTKLQSCTSAMWNIWKPFYRSQSCCSALSVGQDIAPALSLWIDTSASVSESGGASAAISDRVFYGFVLHRTARISCWSSLSEYPLLIHSCSVKHEDRAPLWCRWLYLYCKRVSRCRKQQTTRILFDKP